MTKFNKENIPYVEFVKRYENSIPKRFGLEQLFSAQLLLEKYENINAASIHGFIRSSDIVYFSFGPDSLGSYLIDVGASTSLVANLKVFMEQYRAKISQGDIRVQYQFKTNPFDEELYGGGKFNRFKNEIEIYHLKELQEIVYSNLRNKLHPIVISSLLGPDINVSDTVTEDQLDLFYYIRNSMAIFEVIDSDGRVNLIPIINIPDDTMKCVNDYRNDNSYGELFDLKDNKEITIELNEIEYTVLRVAKSYSDLERHIFSKTYEYDEVKLNFNTTH